jgi:methionyl-tRNA formyltransferase
LRLVFAGTPEFARIALERLHAAGFDIPLVLTQPDRPGGRGMKLQASPVKQFAQAHNIPVAQPRSLRLDGKYPDDAQAARQALLDARADGMVVAAYGLILPQWVLDAMRQPQPGGAHSGLGCLNIHASLLPRWRGAAPIHRAIEAGDTVSGVTIMQMDAGLDTGDMLLMARVAIAPEDTTGSLHDKLATLGGRMVVEVLELAACGGVTATPQPGEGISYAHKIEKHEAQINWQDSAELIARRVRAFDPFPGASTTLAGEPLKIWAATTCAGRPATAQAGQLLAVTQTGIEVATGEGVLLLTQLQRAGGKRLAAADFVRGAAAELQPGVVLGQAAG